MDRGDDNIFDFEDSICFIFCINEIDSSNKKFIVKIIVGCENVDFLVDIGSVCIIIGEFGFIKGFLVYKNRYFIMLIYL